MSHTKPARARERHPSGPLDKRDAFFTNLLLLGFDKGDMESQFNVPFSRDMFLLPNKKCFEVVMHFLFERLNPAMAQDRFRYCWPITDKKQEQAFRKVVNSWLSEIKEEEDSFLPRIVPSLFLSPGGDKFYHLLLHFSRYVVHRLILTENGAKEREVLLHPQSLSKEQDLAGQTGRALQAGCVRHRRSFLAHLQTDLILQEHWTTYAGELVSEYRRLTKELRELEQQIRRTEARLMEQAQDRGSPSATKRRRSGALLDAEWDTMAVRRTQKVQKVRALWQTVEECHASQRQEREVVESILQRAANQYRIDGTDLNVQVPEILLRECHKEIEKQNISNTYEGGKLNLLSLIQLWNLSLRLYLEKLHQAPPADFDALQPEVVTQVHTHHAHLTNLQSLRSSMGQEVLPSLKSSIHGLRRQLALGYEAPTRDTASSTHRRTFLDEGLGLLPATPPVSFEPASQAQDSDDTPTRPINRIFRKASPTTDTPEAVSSLLQMVNRAVAKQGALTQGTPTSTLRLLRDQVNRPSRLPKPVAAETTAEQRMPPRGRMQSAPAPTLPDTGQESPPVCEQDDTLKGVQSSAKRDKQNVGTHHKKSTKESRTGRLVEGKAPARPTPRASAGKAGKQRIAPRSSKKSSTPAPPPPPPQVPGTPPHRPRHDPSGSSVTRAHQVLIDQIADAVVGAKSGSPEFKGLLDTPPSAALSGSPSPPPVGIEDPLAMLDQSAFITRDKLRHSPLVTPAQQAGHSPAQRPVHSPAHRPVHSAPDPISTEEEAVSEFPHQSSAGMADDNSDEHEERHSELLQGMEAVVPEEHQAPTGTLVNGMSPADQSLDRQEIISSLTRKSLRIHHTQRTPPESLHDRSGNANNSGIRTPLGSSPVRLTSDSFTSSPLAMPDVDTSVGEGVGGLVSGPSSVQDTSALGLVDIDQQLSEIFGTRTPQLSTRIRGRASSASPGSVPDGSSSPNMEDAVGRLDFGSSPISEETPEVLQLVASDAAHRNDANGSTRRSPSSDDVVPSSIMSTRKAVSSSKQRGSEGSQKSVTFSDHVDEHNISSYSMSSDLNVSLSNREVFASNGLVSSPYSHHEPSKANGMSTMDSTPSKHVDVVGDAYLSPSAELHRPLANLEISPLDDILSLDDMAGSGSDSFLLDRSGRLEDLLVHVSPAVSPSATPTMTRNRVATGDHPRDTSPGSAPKSASGTSVKLSPDLDDSHRYSLPANISGLSHGSPLSLHDESLLRDLSNLRLRTPGKTPTLSHRASPLTRSPGVYATPKSPIDFDILDEDESVLLPPSPYTLSPATKSPAAVGHLIDI